MFTTIIIFLIILSVLVLAHEFGHFYTARRAGVKAEEFGLGFPPRAIGVYKDKTKRWRHLLGNKALEELSDDKQPQSTVYSLNWLPIGGFVKIKGENGENLEDKDSFSSKKVGQRAFILSAGVIMNVILAFIIFTACYLIGAPQSVDQGGFIQITDIMAKSPAATAGLEPGDEVIAADNQTLANIVDLQTYISHSANKVIDLKIERGQSVQDIRVTPSLKNGQVMIGIGLDQVKIVRLPFFQAIWEGFTHTFIVLWMIVVSLYGLVKDLFIGVSVGDAVGGPVRIAQMTGEMARFGFVNLLNFTALLSLNLAIINIFPFPALDGGRILFLIIEKIKGRPVKKETEALIHNIGFFILIGLILLITYKDIARIL
jgi:regulator of sigma E protease